MKEDAFLSEEIVTVDGIRGTERSFVRFSERRSLSRRKPCRAKSKVDRKPMHLRRARVKDEVLVSGSPHHPSSPSKNNREGLRIY